jgi:hypothetical protein
MPVAESSRSILEECPSRSTLWANPTSQTINSHPKFPLSYLGEVPKAEGGKPAMNQNLDLETRPNPQPTSPLPIWEGRGDRSLDMPINHHNLGEVNHKPLSRLPKWGEAKTAMTPNLDSETRHSHQPTSPKTGKYPSPSLPQIRRYKQ